MVLIVYVLYALGLFLPLLTVVGVIIAHLKRSSTAGTWMESHHRWLIRTFWYGLLWTALGLLTYVILIGWGSSSLHSCGRSTGSFAGSWPSMRGGRPIVRGDPARRSVLRGKMFQEELKRRDMT